ncbi:MAG: beta-galactosidase [Victivallales bacterium]
MGNFSKNQLLNSGLPPKTRGIRTAFTVIMAVLLCGGTASAVQLPGVTYTYSEAPPSYGEKVKAAGVLDQKDALLDSDFSTGVRWNAGDGRPLATVIDFELHGSHLQDRIRIVSVPLNAWWNTPHVKLSAQLAASGEWVTLLDKDWLTLDPQHPKPDDISLHDLVVQADGKEFTHVRLVVSRPNAWINMSLTGVAFYVRQGVELNARPNWQVYFSNQAMKVNLFATNDTGQPMRDVKVDLILRDTADPRIVFMLGTISIPELAAGQQMIPFACKAAAEPGNYDLVPVLLQPKDVKLVVADNNQEVQILAPRSKYWYPIGTCAMGSKTAWYGASATHNWQTVSQPPRGFETGDRVGDFLFRLSKLNLANSICDAFNFRDQKEMGIPENELRAVDSEGKVFNSQGRVSHTPAYSPFLPKWELDPEWAPRLNYWDGHPSFYEYSHSNEYCFVTWLSGGRVLDYSAWAVRGFRQYAKDIHKDIAALNKLYGTNYASFDQVEPPRKYTGPSAVWFDFLRFRKSGLGQYMGKAYQALKPSLPNTPVGFKAIGLDFYDSSTGIDPYLWRDGGDFYGVDIYPFARAGYDDMARQTDMLRTQLGGKPIHVLESGVSYQPVSPLPRTGLDWNLCWWPGFLRGIGGVTFFIWSDGWEGMSVAMSGYELSLGGKPTEQGLEAAKMFKQVQTLSPLLKTGHALGVQIAIYYPTEEMDQIPNTEPVNALYGAYRVFMQTQYPVDVITFHNIRDGELSKYRVLVLPAAEHLYADAAEAIRKFVADGGILIADGRSGFYDQYHRESHLLDDVLGITHGPASDALTSIAVDAKNRIPLPKILTAPSPYGGWPEMKPGADLEKISDSSLPALAPMPRAEIITPDAGSTVLGVFPQDTLPMDLTDSIMPAVEKGLPAGAPAIVSHSYGKGKTLYMAARVFTAYRNYFYTHNLPPYPATREHELENQGDPATRQVLMKFLSDNGIQPPVKIDASAPKPFREPTGMPNDRFQFISYWGNGDGALLGITNWGPEIHYDVPLSVELPFDKVSALYCMETFTQELYPLEYKLEGNRLSCNLPRLEATVILIAVNRSGPVLAMARQEKFGGTVSVKVCNYLPEATKGAIEVRLDGEAEPLSAMIPYSLKANESATYALDLKPPSASRLLDEKGTAKPLFVWVTYDGSARCFAKVFPGPAVK